MRFRSKVDLWLGAIMLMGMLAALAGAGLAWQRAGAWPAALISVLLGVGLPAWLMLTTAYVVKGDELAIRSGPFSRRIPLAAISQVTPTRSILSSPALSLDRLRIDYGPGNQWVMVSPADREGFLKAIRRAPIGR